MSRVYRCVFTALLYSSTEWMRCFKKIRNEFEMLCVCVNVFFVFVCVHWCTTLVGNVCYTSEIFVLNYNIHFSHTHTHTSCCKVLKNTEWELSYSVCELNSKNSLSAWCISRKWEWSLDSLNAHTSIWVLFSDSKQSSYKANRTGGID